MSERELQDEIRLVILFYSNHGWKWIDVVDYLIHRWRKSQ